MAFEAINQVTGEKVAAKDLKKSRRGLNDIWVCPTCGAKMIPVACGTKKYKVKPYFRAVEQHHGDCDWDGKITRVTKGESRSIKESIDSHGEIPDRFRPRKHRQQLVSAENAGKVAKRKPQYRRDNVASSAEGKSRRPDAGSLFQLVEPYLTKPSSRKSPLSIDGVSFRTYETCIRRLKAVEEYRKFAYRILFAPIRYRGLDQRPNYEIGIDLDVTVEMDSTIEIARLGRFPRYRVLFLTKEWHPRTRAIFTKTLLRAVQIQKERHEKPNPSPVNVFFLGTQDERDLTTFLVDDHRFVCFYNLSTSELIR